MVKYSLSACKIIQFLEEQNVDGDTIAPARCSKTGGRGLAHRSAIRIQGKNVSKGCNLFICMGDL